MKIKYLLTLALAAMVATSSLSSCEEYLEKDPDTDVSKDEAFKNFMNFQGYIEEIYKCIPDKISHYNKTSFNWGDDEIMNVHALTTWQVGPQFDLGNFWAWQANKLQENQASWMDKTGDRSNGNTPKDGNLWGHAWYCIRKCNLGIENMSLMTDATQEEKDMILGQLYFFRAWWHFELIQYFGGMPYVDYSLPADVPHLDRLTFQECAERCAEDFRKAADLLPMNWNDTAAGGATANNNQFYANKAAALGYLGKAYLWAASPLAENGAQVGALSNGTTYKYNQEYAAKAADALGELLTKVEAGETQFSLVPFGYEGDNLTSEIYDHKHMKDSGTELRYTEIFYTALQNFKQPGATEGIFYTPNASAWAIWNFGLTWGPKVNSICTHDAIIHHPTANLIDQYGMKNGLPIDDPASGYDVKHPYKNRDPRFYHDVVFDGFEYVCANDKAPAGDKYASLYTGGLYRGNDMASRTGYYFQKLVPHQVNLYDWNQDWGKHYTPNLMYLRLADVYLMYAEAVAAASDSEATSKTCTLTARDAVNKIRERCGAAGVDVKFTGNDFIDEVRRERAVELSFEGLRFNDLQRWLLLTEAPYNTKYAHEFDRVESDAWYETNDPCEAEVANFRKVNILTRPFSAKHYWLPLKVADVSIYEGFSQNPGW